MSLTLPMAMTMRAAGTPKAKAKHSSSKQVCCLKIGVKMVEIMEPKLMEA